MINSNLNMQMLRSFLSHRRMSRDMIKLCSKECNAYGLAIWNDRFIGRTEDCRNIIKKLRKHKQRGSESKWASMYLFLSK